jgi:hypothetical protein
MKNGRTFAAVIGAAALAGLVSGARANSVSTETGAAARASASNHARVTTTLAGQRAANLDDQAGKHDCKGKNDCKGAGGCKSGDNGCKGKNSCKGKGGCKSATTQGNL